MDQPLIERVAGQLRPLSNRGYDYLNARGVIPLINLDVFYSVFWRSPLTLNREEWVCTPIWNVFYSDTPVGLYLRSTESKDHMLVFKPGMNGYYYGLTNVALDEILEKKFVVLTEGVFDSLSTTIRNSLGCLTNRISSILLEHLIILNVTVYYIPDNDMQGERHLDVIQGKLKERGIKLEIMRVPSKYKDLSEFMVEDSVRHSFFINSLKG